MTIDIITPTEKLFSGTAKRINLPGSKGSFEILENHAPIVSTLAAGNVVIVDEQNQEQTFDYIHIFIHCFDSRASYGFSDYNTSNKIAFFICY